MKKGVQGKLFRQINKDWRAIIRETQKYNTTERNNEYFGPGFSNIYREHSWKPRIDKTLHSYEIAESEEQETLPKWEVIEEQETLPKWGDIEEKDITFKEK